jgi:uncharacterized membrane protein
MQMLLTVHIAAGGVAIVFGGMALLAPKGRMLHRRIGILFVYSMLTLGISASILGFLKGQNANVLGGLTSVYFATTALATVRPVSVWSRRLDLGAVGLAFTLALIQFGLAFKALASPNFALNGVPAPMIVFMAAIALLAGIGDLR